MALLVRGLLLLVAMVAVGLTGFHVGRAQGIEALRTDLALSNPLGFWAERGPLLTRYGATPRYSIGYEEWMIRDYFQDERGGVFLDVGAADAREASNTYFLEAQLGWSGVAVDAVPEYGAGYRQYRPHTRFVSFFVSDRSDADVAFNYLPGRPLASSGDRAFADEWRDGGSIQTKSVKMITLNDLLPRLGLSRVDFVSMDIEQYEPQALAGFNIQQYRPRLLCVEAHAPVRQQILDYFYKNGYVLVGKYLRADGYNLWFKPFGASAPALEPGVALSH